MSSVKCECGLRYVPGLESNEEAHREWHEEYLHGPVIATAQHVPSAASLEGFRVVVADQTVPLETRRELAYAARVAQRTIPSYPTGYDGTQTPDDDRLFLLVTGPRVVALALVGRDDHFWKLRWTASGQVELVTNEAVRGERRKIGRIWVAKALQRMGLARALVHHVSTVFGTDVGSSGWELPISLPGRALVRRLAPTEWLGHGDHFAVQSTLGNGED